MGSVAVVSLHTSPLAQPGTGDAGGMNVYVRELSASLAQAGVDVRVYVRRWADHLPDRVRVEPGFEVVHVSADRFEDKRTGAVEWAEDYLKLEHERGVIASLKAWMRRI